MRAVEKLELKIPPVIVWLALALLMKFAAGVAPRFAFPWLRQPEIAIVLVVVGVLIAVLGVGAFRQARTTVDPRRPKKTSALVTSGIYRVTRNPTYLGMFVVLASWALWLGQLLPLVLPPLFVAILNRWQIAPEERALDRLFGASFAAYRAKVRRWI